MFLQKNSAWQPATALLCCLPIVSGAQEPDIEEIVVTADYRGRPASELPSSITILDADTIAETAVQHFEELTAGLANFNWSGDGHRAKYFQIRGVGELAQYQGAPNPSVGFVVDDIDFSGIGSIATLWDIERIEILRGPQGTRYGSNALAGLVYLQSTAPGDKFEGKVQVTAGNDDALGGGIAFGGPLGESVAAYRFSAHRFSSNGFRDNAYLQRDDTNGRDETTLRARLDWSLGSDWEFRLTGMHGDIDDGYDAFAIDNSLTVLSDRPGKDAQRSTGGSMSVSWTGSRHVRIDAVTSAADSDSTFSFDADWGNGDAWAPITYDYVSRTERDRRTLHQEIRVLSTDESRLFGGTTDWLAGIYLNRLDEGLLSINRGEYFDPDFDFSASLDDRLDSSYRALSVALFGQIGFDVGNAGNISLGARVENRSVDYADTTGLAVSPGETMVGGEVAWTYDFDDEVTGYVSLARGYKGGGFNLGVVPAGRREFGPESMWNLEAGLRGMLADDRVFLQGAVFYSRRIDQQVETSFQIDPNDPASFVFFTDNAARGETWGLEASLRWLVTDFVELHADLGLLRAEFDRFVTPQIDASGRDQAHAPRYTFAVGGVYRNSAGWFGRIDVTGKDRFFFDVSHDQVSSPYALARFRAGYDGDRWSAELWVQNGFDRRYAVRGFYFGNEPPLFPPTLYVRQGDPRHFGATFELRF